MRETIAPSAERARERAGAAAGAAIASATLPIAGILTTREARKLSNAGRGELKVLPAGLPSGAEGLGGVSFLVQNASDQP